MVFFQKIYDAAKAKHSLRLKILLQEGACIDEREERSWLSPAGKLAREGDIKSAYFLINHFGASIEFVIYGFVKNGNKNEADALAKKYSLDPESAQSLCMKHFPLDDFFKMLDNYSTKYARCAYPDGSGLYTRNNFVAAIVSGNIEDAQQQPALFEKTIADLIQYAAFGGHLYFIEHLFTAGHALPTDMYIWLVSYNSGFPMGYPSVRFRTKELALHSLSFISNPDFFKAIVEVFLNNDLIEYSIIEVAQKALRIHSIMNDQQLDYESALALSHNQVDGNELTVNNGFFKATISINPTGIVGSQTASVSCAIM